ncbi:MAG TPA: alkene reductase [Candidatus Corynebacterium avicola]|uniref:Alkene reductase n=1 Tax=Candidatus Corynebacterium avicola TaxID=2838527 RepID=A0A9D1UMI2_9CORY|nr:alkene reductase [Candidatus Corynebacterium avicola]
MTSLFDSLDAGDLKLNNRVTMAALTRQRSGEDGNPTELHAEYYSQRASSGLVVTEGTFPAFSNRAFPGQAGIASTEHAEGWARVAEAVHAKGGTLVMQIMHGGRTSHPDLLRGAEPEAPSAIAVGGPVRGFSGKEEGGVPRELGTEEIPRIIEEFVTAARRAVDAGVDGVEIHSANGYLLHEFLGASSNHRGDAYGGSPENRTRLTAEVVRAVAEEIGAGRTAVRISPEHGIQGVLEDDRVDVLATYDALIDGLNEVGPAYLSVLHKDIDGDLVAHLRGRFNGTFLLNSGFSQITGRDEAVHIVEDDLADAAVVGRQLIANPDLVRRWQDGLSLNEPDPSTFYSPGAVGYTDYAFAE